MVIWTSLQACGVVFPFAISTSICRSKFTICSGLYLFIGMTGLPPGEFSLISPGTKIPGQVTFVFASTHDTQKPLGSVKKAHRGAVTRAGIKGHVRLYDLRHTFATR